MLVKSNNLKCGALALVLAVVTGCSQSGAANQARNTTVVNQQEAGVQGGNTTMSRTGTLVMYREATEIGRESYTDNGQTFSTQIVVANQRGNITLERGNPRSVQIEANGHSERREIPAGAVLVENGSFQLLALAAEQFPEAVQAQAIQAFIASQNATVPARIQVTPHNAGRHIELTVAGITMTADIASNGTVERAEVPVQRMVALPVGSPAPTASPPSWSRAAPTDIREAPVEIRLPDAVLHGVFWTPANIAANQRIPAVLMIAGSGPTDRDGNNPLGVESDAYRLAAAELVHRGIAVLRYDKRGIAGSTTTLPESQTTIDTMVSDARSLLGYLRSQPQVSRVTVLGHSEGGIVALLLAQHDNLDGLVLVASPGRRLDLVLREQLAAQFSGPEMTQIDAAIQAIRQGQALGPFPPALAPLFRPSVLPFLRSLMNVDPAGLLHQTRLPVSIIQGEHDVQVTPTDARTLSAARSTGVRTTMLPLMNHVFRNEATLDRNQASYTNPNLPLSPGLIDAIVAGVTR